MKACLVLPPIRDFYLSPQRLSALGLAALERILAAEGWETAFFCAPLMAGAKALPLPPELSYLQGYLIPGESGPLTWWTGYKHFGPAFESLARTVLGENPGVVFLGAFAWAYAEEARQTARAIKSLSPGTLLVAGGGACALKPEYFFPSADFVWTGEAEPGFARFLKILSRVGTAPQALKNPFLRRELAEIPNLVWEGPESPSPAGPAFAPGTDLFPALREMPPRGEGRRFALSAARGC
ncbi:MAG: cobalamin B12-binding domain-containing protein, partial [Spirochaetales bacterium]|nr:cobalamin B12-binding domain-containing protein [Spirochaetales bacterium]